MPAHIQLYDLGRRDATNTCWSYNVWKARLALNYKKIPYSTIWLDHDTLGPTLRSLGVPENTSGQGFPFTVPTIRGFDGSMTTDSAAIAKELESLYPDPSPSLHLDEKLQTEANNVVHMIAMPLFAIYMPRVARDIIPESTVPTFAASREKRFGMSLAELESTRGGEKAWKNAEPGFNAMKALLENHKTDFGPFIRGSKVCYADFILVALIEAFRRVGMDTFDRIVAWDKSFGLLYEAARGWLQNDQ